MFGKLTKQSQKQLGKNINSDMSEMGQEKP